MADSAEKRATDAKSIEDKESTKADLEAKIESLSKLISTLNEEITAAKTDIANSEVAINSGVGARRASKPACRWSAS